MRCDKKARLSLVTTTSHGVLEKQDRKQKKKKKTCAWESSIPSGGRFFSIGRRNSIVPARKKARFQRMRRCCALDVSSQGCLACMEEAFQDAVPSLVRHIRREELGPHRSTRSWESTSIGDTRKRKRRMDPTVDEEKEGYGWGTGWTEKKCGRRTSEGRTGRKSYRYGMTRRGKREWGWDFRITGRRGDRPSTVQETGPRIPLVEHA